MISLDEIYRLANDRRKNYRYKQLVLSKGNWLALATIPASAA